MFSIHLTICSGFARNILGSINLAREWHDEGIVQQLVAKLPWGHNRQILGLLNGAEREL